MELLLFLRSADVKLWVDGERLRCNAPQGVLTPALQAELSEKKAEIITLLQKGLAATRLNMDSIAPVPRDRYLSQSFAQQRLWFLDQLTPNSRAYYTSFAVNIHGSLQVVVLEQCLNEMIRRHETLRTTFKMVGQEPVQVINPPTRLHLPLIDLSNLSPQEQELQTSLLFELLAQQPYDLERDLLLRQIVLQLGTADYRLLLAMHHIISDGWSMGIFTREMLVLYNAFVNGNSSPLPDLPIQYADFAVWQRQRLQGDYLSSLLKYWHEQLAGAPPLLELPLDHPRPPVQRHAGADLLWPFPLSLTQTLRAFSQREGVTLFMTLFAAFQVLVAHFSGQEDLVVGIITANRTRKELEDLIGFFVNTLVLRTDLSGNPSFRELLRRVRQVALGAFAHQELPFEKLVEELQPERTLSYHPLIQVLFDFRNIHKQNLELFGMNFESTYIDKTAAAAFDLEFEIEDDNENLHWHVLYNPELFDKSTVIRIAEHFLTILKQVVAAPEQRLWNLSLLTAAERAKILVEWNSTQVSFPQNLCFPQLFEKQVAVTPDAIALVYNNEYLTYQELNARADLLAHHLQQLEIFPEQVVALLAPRSPDFLIAVLAIFKIGAAYLPLDPHHPPQRLAQILAQSGTSLVLTSSEFLSGLEQACVSLLGSSHPQIKLLADFALDTQLQSNLAVSCDPRQLAYIIYTSGSTGTPKGVMVEHRGMLNHIHAKIKDLSLTRDDFVAQTASQCFDISVWQFLAPLLVGGRVQILQDEEAHAPQELLAAIQRQRVTVLEVVPSLLQALLEELDQGIDSVVPHLDSLRWMLLTGEALPAELCCRWLAHYPQIPILNAYGPTECSDDVTHYLISNQPSAIDQPVPIGRPVANTQVYVLDSYLELTPIGIPGELYVGGVQIGRGYLHLPSLTSERFVPDPFGGTAGARLYRTGDKARYRPDGSIEFLGRLDQQVKLRGYRIELGEVEAALRAQPGVRNAVVALRKGRGTEQERLVAYVVTTPLSEKEQESRGWNPEALRSALRERLPAYMVPAAFVTLDELPLMSNGKLDRQRLPEPKEAHIAGSRNAVPPRTKLEEVLAGIWSELLHFPQISIYDNFFELGGHSLLAVQLLNQVKQRLGFSLSLANLFQSPTIAQLAPLLQANGDQSPHLSRSLIVPIRAGGTKRPFFCIHPISGDLYSYLGLARYLDQDQPFYGIQECGLGAYQDQKIFTNIEQMAETYVDALLEAQPAASYALGGHSFGGLVAFEMARQLLARGRKVSLLALFDSHWEGKDTMEVVSTLLGEDEDPISEAQWITDLAAVLENYRGKKTSIAFHELSQLSSEAQLAYLLDHLVASEVLPQGTQLAELRGLLRVIKANQNSLRIYRPRTYQGRITLICCERATFDPATAWARFSPEPLEIHTVPGDHFSMITEPRVKFLATQLQRCLDQANAD